MKSSMVETLIGAAVIAIAAGFFIYAYQVSDRGATASGYRLVAEFDNAEGVNVGTDVRMEITVEHHRQHAPAQVVKLPFYEPEWKKK